ncbi:MAG: hypothetical protein IJN67_05885 [Oscillospiraceae bacterium]|nr:hypothetical protein [Oscillospiraceae bacterium]
MSYGLRKSDLKKIILESVNKNPDLKYYINDDYIYELVDGIVDGVSIAIEENTKEVIRQIEHDLRRRH